MATVFIGLGSNLGHREANLELAMKRFAPEFVIKKASPIYESNVLYRPGRPRYLNMVCRVETSLTPELAYDKCAEIERSMGRQKALKHELKAIDVDLLLYDNVVLRTPKLSIPHPRMHDRAFVLVPLQHIGGSVVHPILKRTVDQLVLNLGDYSRKVARVIAG